jgi:copper chaperone NosL
LNKDKCDFCEMTISNGRLGVEIITQKGRAYKFDDLNCLKGYMRENNKTPIASYFINDYAQSNILIDATKALYVSSENIKSPMGGNTAAFKNKEAATDFATKQNTVVKTWAEINP